MKKKGVLFTISLVMIASIVLALAILNFRNAETTKQRLSEFGSLDRLYSIDSSIAIGFKELFNAYSGINITVNNDQDVTFEESLPNNNADNFEANLDNYKNYIENQDSNVILNIGELKNELPLIIFPNNITYKHNSFGSNQIIINPKEINFNKYYVEIEPSFAIDSCSWSTSPGNLEFELDINEPSCDKARNIDPSQNNLIDINNGGILIRINNSLYIENNLDAVNVKTTISLDEIPEEKIEVFAGREVININYENLNISKHSGFSIV